MKSEAEQRRTAALKAAAKARLEAERARRVAELWQREAWRCRVEGDDDGAVAAMRERDAFQQVAAVVEEWAAEVC